MTLTSCKLHKHLKPTCLLSAILSGSEATPSTLSWVSLGQILRSSKTQKYVDDTFLQMGHSTKSLGLTNFSRHRWQNVCPQGSSFGWVNMFKIQFTIQWCLDIIAAKPPHILRNRFRKSVKLLFALAPGYFCQFFLKSFCSFSATFVDFFLFSCSLLVS